MPGTSRVKFSHLVDLKIYIIRNVKTTLSYNLAFTTPTLSASST